MGNQMIASGKLAQLWKITIFNGKTHFKWQFSIAMLVYQMMEVTNNMTLVLFKKTKNTHTHKKKNSNSDTGNRTDIVIAWVISIYFLSTNRGG